MEAIRYKDFVDYETLDPVKKLAMEIFEPTLSYPERLGIELIPESLGGTAPVYRFNGVGTTDFCLAHNVEGLGTKIDIADKIEEMRQVMEKMKISDYFQEAKHFRGPGTDTVRMSVNDLAGTGADPFSYMDIISCGSSKYYGVDPETKIPSEKTRQLLLGIKDAADEDGFAVPGGETPELPNIVYPGTIDLAGSSIGLIRPSSRFLSENRIRKGDVIYGISSSGVHANGISKIRNIAAKLKDGYFTQLESGRTLGEEVLVPTAGYARPMCDCLDEGVEIHFAQPITGHGWEKIARAKKPFNYEIEHIPKPSPLFRQLIEFGKEGGFDVSDKENYYVWNMDIGWVVIAPKSEGSEISRIFGKYGKQVYELGNVVPGERIVDMKPFGFNYKP
jgi:phosphoribosylformylglycinamidine cyclo-ligase